MSINVKKLTKVYGTHKALDNISFETRKNSIIGFLGPNGAGKSTCMKILGGILPYTSGTCSIEGLNIQVHPISVKRNLGFLPETTPLYEDMYVREQLIFEANTHRLQHKKEQVDRVLRQTGLWEEQHKKVAQLSKGYRQRLGLAMCIIHDPAVLILDEPTAGLDPNQIIEIRALIKELGKQKTVLISTHLMQEVEAICDEVIILNRGKIEAHFDLKDLPQLYPSQSLEEIFVRLTK